MSCLIMLSIIFQALLDVNMYGLSDAKRCCAECHHDKCHWTKCLCAKSAEVIGFKFCLDTSLFLFRLSVQEVTKAIHHQRPRNAV